jgi:opacity protein-like surface antigen
MRSVCVAAAAIVVAASPAFAQSARRAQAQRSPQAISADGYGGQKRYSDPDPNVRFEMMRQENWRKGG